MSPRGNYEKQQKAFEFFTKRVEDGQSFSLQEVADYCGWLIATPQTYITKKWNDFLERLPDGFYSVKPEFKRISKDDFLGQATQKSPIYTGYLRTKHENVVIFEFLLPLTREDKLRSALDELFYADCVEQRIKEIGLNKMEKVVLRPDGLGDEDYLKLLVEEAGVFGGYSISHVSGRFRANDLMSRKSAGELLADGKRYLIDETTALVRFIIPCTTGSLKFKEEYGRDTSIHGSRANDHDKLKSEVQKIRGLFFLLFVEAVVRIVRGEDEIWLIETGVCNSVYRWQARK